jgi:ribosomal protein L7/L12
MKFNLFGLSIIVEKRKLTAQEIERYYLEHHLSGYPKVGLIKAARELDKSLGLRDAKNLVESLFYCNIDSYSIK